MPQTLTKIRSQATLNPLTWYEATVTFDGTTAILYLNGSPVATAPIITPFEWKAPQLRFGQWAGTKATAVRFLNPSGGTGEGGVDDWISVAHSASMNITGSTFSVEAWVRKDLQASPPINQTLVGRATIGSVAWHLDFFYHAAQFTVWTTVGPAIITGNTNLSDGQWYHLSATYDGAFIRLYVNAQEVATPVAITGTILSMTAPVLFGALETETTSERYPLFGDIAEVRIWNVARTQTQLIANLNNVTAPQSGLVGLWRLDEASGTTANDVSGNANTGTLTNGPIWINSIGGVTMEELRVWTTVRTPAQIQTNEPQACGSLGVTVDSPLCAFTANQVFWQGVDVDTTIDYSAFRGKVLIVDLNDLSSCVPCQWMTQESFIPLYAQYAASGLEILNVSGTHYDTIPSIRDAGRNFLHADGVTTGIPYHLAYVPRTGPNQIYWNYKVFNVGPGGTTVASIPVMVIIDRNGIVRSWSRYYHTKSFIETIIVPLLAESFGGEITPPVAGLLAQYHFEETTGSSAADASTNNNHAALSGTWLWEGTAFSGSAAYGGKVEINLWWDPIVDAQSYNVKRSATSGGAYTLLGNTIPHNYRDVNVVPGTSYYYKVYPVTDAVEGTPSQELTAIPTAVPAETPAPKLVVVLGR